MSKPFLSQLISIAQRTRSCGGKNVPNLSKMVEILVSLNRILHIHLAHLKLTWTFDERRTADERIDLALDIEEKAIEDVPIEDKPIEEKKDG